MSLVTTEELDAVHNHIGNIPPIGAMYAPVLIGHARALLTEVERLRAERDHFKRELHERSGSLLASREEVERLRAENSTAYQRGAEAEKPVEWTVTEEGPCVVTTEVHGHFVEVAPTVKQGLWAWRIEPVDKRVRAKGTAPTFDEAKFAAIRAARGVP